MFSGFEFFRLTETPGPDFDDEAAQRRRADGPDALAAAIAGAHSDLLASLAPGASLLTAWMRAPGERGVRFLVGGRPFFPPAVRDDGLLRSLRFPPGSKGLVAPTSDVETALRQFGCWLPVAGRQDPLWTPGQTAAEVVRRGAFHRYLASLPGPFAWVVLGEPLAADDVQPLVDLLVTEILPLTRGEVGEAKRVELERKRARHRELSRARNGGIWQLRILAGALDDRAARSAAATLSAAAELGSLPYVLEPMDRILPLDDALAASADDGVAFAAGPELVGALLRPPERELAGVRVVGPPAFDLNDDTPAALSQRSLVLGDILDETAAPVEPLRLLLPALNRHTFVCGATGAGKSQTVRHLLQEATGAGLPWLVIEPAKAEYARMSVRLGSSGDVFVIRPGDPDSLPAGMNPLEPARGFPLQTHADLLKALFLAAFESYEPFPQILSAALIRCYEEKGWDLTLGEPQVRGTHPVYPTLGDLQRVAAQVVIDIGYGAQASADVSGFIKVRLNSLRLGTTGRFFEGGHPLQFDQLRTRNVVLELEDIGDDSDKAFLMGAVLMRYSEELRVQAAGSTVTDLSHLTVIEEAHRLLRRAEPGTAGASAKAVEMFASLLAEVRAYGEGIVVAEQIPSKITIDVIKNTAIKIVHRLPALDDRESVGATMNLSERQSRYVVTLTPGTGVVFADGMDRPVLVKVPDGTTAERGDLRPAPLGKLVRRRSATCSVTCEQTACTLRDMRNAQQLLETHQWMVMWAELTVLAHLVGEHTPEVDVDRLPPLTPEAAPGRVLECAMSHAVDAAVASRSRAFGKDVDPEYLAVHCCESIKSIWAGAPSPSVCSDHGSAFLAERFRIGGVRQALAGLDPDAPRPEESSAWESQLGIRLPGKTVGALQSVANELLEQALDDAPARRLIGFGDASPSILESAVGGGGVTSPDWNTRLNDALAPFRARWPDDHLMVPHDIDEDGK